MLDDPGVIEIPEQRHSGHDQMHDGGEAPQPGTLRPDWQQRTYLRSTSGSPPAKAKCRMIGLPFINCPLIERLTKASFIANHVIPQYGDG